MGRAVRGCPRRSQRGVHRVDPVRHPCTWRTQIFEGAGFIAWNAANSSYNLYWLSSSSPEPGFFTGRWEGGNAVFDGHEYVAEQRFASRHSITEISAEAFVYTVDMGSAPDNLNRAATIQYSRD